MATTEMGDTGDHHTAIPKVGRVLWGKYGKMDEHHDHFVCFCRGFRISLQKLAGQAWQDPGDTGLPGFLLQVA